VTGLIHCAWQGGPPQRTYMVVRAHAAQRRRLAAALRHLEASTPQLLPCNSETQPLSEANAVLERHQRNWDRRIHFPAGGNSMPCPFRSAEELEAGRQLSAVPHDRSTTTCFAVVGDFGTGLSVPHITRPTLITNVRDRSPGPVVGVCNLTRRVHTQGANERGLSTRTRISDDGAADPVGYLQVAELVRSWDVDFVLTSEESFLAPFAYILHLHGVNLAFLRPLSVQNGF
jgi:hypothetical protein